jgi:hypothetical protein
MSVRFGISSSQVNFAATQKRSRHDRGFNRPHRADAFINAMKSSNKYRASCGPGDASG